MPGAARSGGGCGAAARQSRSRRTRSPERCIGTVCPLRNARVRLLGSRETLRGDWATFKDCVHAWGRTGVRAQVPLKVVRPGGGVLAAGEGAHVHHRHCELQDELLGTPETLGVD